MITDVSYMMKFIFDAILIVMTITLLPRHDVAISENGDRRWYESNDKVCSTAYAIYNMAYTCIDIDQ